MGPTFEHVAAGASGGVPHPGCAVLGEGYHCLAVLGHQHMVDRCKAAESGAGVGCQVLAGTRKTGGHSSGAGSQKHTGS